MLCATTALIVGLTMALPAVASRDEPKLKVKYEKTVAADKSKPVRKAIESWYAENVDAFERKDVAAIMALRTEDFHTLTPDGKRNTRAAMEMRTHDLVGRIDHFILQDFRIGTIDVAGDLATADIHQRTVRMQRFPDGTLHKVDASVLQRETWKHVPEGWRLYRVDDIRDSVLLVDDAPYASKP